MNGFLGAPDVGNFELNLDLALNKTETVSRQQNQSLGYGTRVSVFPKGNVPLGFYFRRWNYRLDMPESDAPVLMPLYVDHGDTVGGSATIKRGVLRGLRFGIDRARTVFQDPSAENDLIDISYLHWTRGSRRFRNTLSLERRYREFGIYGFNHDVYLANLSQSAELSPAWTWAMWANATSRTTESQEEVEDPGMTDFRLTSRWSRTYRRGDRLNFDLRAGAVQPQGLRSTQLYGATVQYNRSLGGGWQLSPTGQLAFENSAERTISSPRLGLDANRRWAAGRFDGNVTFGGGFGKVTLRESDFEREEALTSTKILATVGHGSYDGLRKEIQLEHSRSELRFERNGGIDDPEIEPIDQGLGVSDVLRVAMILGHRWDSSGIDGSVAWTRREGARAITLQQLSSSIVTGILTVRFRRFSLTGSGGFSSIERSEEEPERLDYGSIRLRWNPGRKWNVYGLYRAESRQNLLFPDRDLRRAELGFRWNIAQFYVRAGVFRLEEQSEGGLGGTRHVYSWAIGRAFGGWLPIITGRERRGTIR